MARQRRNNVRIASEIINTLYKRIVALILIIASMPVFIEIGRLSQSYSDDSHTQDLNNHTQDLNNKIAELNNNITQLSKQNKDLSNQFSGCDAEIKMIKLQYESRIKNIKDSINGEK